MDISIPDYSRLDSLKKSSFAAAGTLSFISMPLIGTFSSLPVKDGLNMVGAQGSI